LACVVGRAVVIAQGHDPQDEQQGGQDDIPAAPPWTIR
jgi:hypothetical protein